MHVSIDFQSPLPVDFCMKGSVPDWAINTAPGIKFPWRNMSTLGEAVSQSCQGGTLPAGHTALAWFWKGSKYPAHANLQTSSEICCRKYF